MLQTEEDWRSIVIQGAKAPHGMASFARFLTPADAEDIRAYVITEARKAQAAPASSPKATAPIG
jgi:quinohemoprotein ethanol dehydrogenase